MGNIMKNTTVLPNDFSIFTEIDLQKNKKLAILVYGICFAIIILSTFIGLNICPFTNTFGAKYQSGGEIELIPLCIKLIATAISLILYIVLHELIHGIFFKAFGKVKPKYGFNLLYAYAGSDAYYNKISYIIIGLAPVVILGLILLTLNFIVPIDWFWVVYIVQINNLSGAAGDYYVTIKLSTIKQPILVHDSGTSMTIYSKQN